MFDVCFVIFFR